MHPERLEEIYRALKQRILSLEPI